MSTSISNPECIRLGDGTFNAVVFGILSLKTECFFGVLMILVTSPNGFLILGD